MCGSPMPDRLSGSPGTMTRSLTTCARAVSRLQPLWCSTSHHSATMTPSAFTSGLFPPCSKTPLTHKILSAQLADPRRFALGLLDAREMGDDARYQALHALAEQIGEPTWDRERGEFYYRFGLDEPYPRGQANAVMLAAEAGGKQARWRAFNEPNLRKFDQPTVSGVDFPRLGISQAIYDEEKEILAVSTYAADPWLAGTATTFAVDHLREPAQSRLLRDGSVYEGWRVSGETSIEIKAEVQDHAYLVMRV